MKHQQPLLVLDTLQKLEAVQELVLALVMELAQVSLLLLVLGKVREQVLVKE